MLTKWMLLAALTLPLVTESQEWKKLQDEASASCEQGDFPKAIIISTKALDLVKRDRKADPVAVYSLRSEHAAYHLLDKQVDAGIALFEPLLAEIQAAKSSKAESDARQNYGIGLLYLGRYTEALPHLNRAISLQDELGAKPEDKVAVISSAAACYQNLYQFEKAEEMYRQALAICTKNGMTKTVDYGNTLSNLALLYRDMELPVKAFENFEAAEKVYMGAGDTLNPQFAVFLSDYGTMLTNFQQHEKAMSLLFRSRDLTRRMFTENSFEYATSLNNLGYAYNRMHKLVEAEQFYLQSIQLKKSQSYSNESSYYTALNNLMLFYLNAGRKADAVELAEELQKGLDSKEFTDTMKRATFSRNLGTLYYELSEYEKSHRFYKDAIRYFKAIYGGETEHIADIYVDMGAMLQVSGHYPECVESLNKAAAIFGKRTTGSRLEDIDVLCNTALILRSIGKPADAEPMIDKAIELTEKLNTRDVEQLENVAVTKAMIAGELNKVQEAMTWFNKFMDMKYNQLDVSFSFMTETEKMFFLDKFETQIRNFYTNILNHIDKYPEVTGILIDFRIRTKAYLLNNMTKIRRQVIERNDPELNKRFEELKLKRESVAKLMSFDTQEYPYALAEATALKAEADLIEKDISRRVSALNQASSVRLSWKDIQKTLAPGEAAVEIFQCNLLYPGDQGMGTNYTYVVIKDKGEPTYASIDRTLSWEENVLSSYRTSIENKQADTALYRRLWKPVSQKLAGVSTIYVSPDGVYNQVNLNSLLNPATGKFLIEENEIHLLTSLRDLLPLKQAKPIKPENCVLVGNPKFDYDISRLQSAQPGLSGAVATRGMYGFQLSELPGTKTEVEVIRKTLEKNGMKAAVFTEVNANESAIKKVSNPDVLHLATHGFFLEDPPAENLQGYSKMEKEFYMNPMLRSGIFLSGANKTYTLSTGNISSLKEFEDGMLTAYEAMNLKLDETELVVLSACQTGLGKVKNGEGVFGLQRAFKLAGAKSVIMSLWPVSDDATRDLMIAFYDAWTRSGSVYKAFREAQLEVKKKYPQPYYWGAFVLSGR